MGRPPRTDYVESSWPHAPPHKLAEAGVNFVTARTLGRVPHFRGSARLDLMRDRLLRLAAAYGWRLEAWAVLENHYHLVAQSPLGETGAVSLRRWLRHLHAELAREVNRLDGTPGRQVWHNFRETLLVDWKSYFARLHYTHANAVHHGIVQHAADYAWCSAKEWLSSARPSTVKTVLSFPCDRIILADEDTE